MTYRSKGIPRCLYFWLSFLPLLARSTKTTIESGML
jgi:hypothetical protein